MTSTQALLSNTLEEIQDGQSLGCFQIQGGLSFDLSDRQSLGGFQAGESSSFSDRQIVGDPQGSPKLQNRQNGNPGRDAGVELLEEYDAETELDEDSNRIKSKLQDEMVVGAGRQVSGSEDPQDGDDQELFLGDVNGFIHQANILDPDDFEGIQTNNLDPNDFKDIPNLKSEIQTVADLQKEVSEQITEFDATWYGEQSQAVEEKNSDSKEKEGNLMETELEEREMLEKRREDLLAELRKQSESNLKMPTFKLPTFSLPMGILRAKTVPNMPSNNVTLVGRSVQVITLTHNLGFCPQLQQLISNLKVLCSLICSRIECPAVHFASWAATPATPSPPWRSPPGFATQEKWVP